MGAAGCGSTEGANTDTAGFAELEQAAGEAARCIEDLGYSVDDPEYDESAFTFGFSYSRGTDDLAEDPEATRCIDVHFEPVNDRWQQSNMDQIEAGNREFDRKLAACLRERGEDVTELTSEVLEELSARVPDMLLDCRQLVAFEDSD